jgi:ORF6N domain
MISIQIIREKVLEIRGEKVILDNDLAELYGVDTRSLKQSVKRNISRFPEDFMFELSKAEITKIVEDGVIESKSNFGGASPYAFTEQGVAMLSSVLRSDKAIQVNIAIMRAFVMMRQYAMNFKDLKDKLDELEARHDNKFDDIYEVLDQLLSSKNERKEIGFQKNTTESQV